MKDVAGRYMLWLGVHLFVGATYNRVGVAVTLRRTGCANKKQPAPPLENLCISAMVLRIWAKLSYFICECYATCPADFIKTTDKVQ